MAGNTENKTKPQSWFKVDIDSDKSLVIDGDVGTSGSDIVDTSFLRDITIRFFETEAEMQVDIWRRGRYKTKSLVGLSKIIKLNNCPFIIRGNAK